MRHYVDHACLLSTGRSTGLGRQELCNNKSSQYLNLLKNSKLKIGNFSNFKVLTPTVFVVNTGRLVLKNTVFSAWASTLNMGLINKG